MAEMPNLTAARLREFLADVCPRVRIDLAGAMNLPCRLPHEPAWREWVASGRHAGLSYMSRDPAGRADPTRDNPWARSVLVFAQRYTDGWGLRVEIPWGESGSDQPWTDGVARYARGFDYHDVLRRDISSVIAALKRELPGLRAHPAVDTGPYLERELAWLAGLGFFGKNTCLIHERLGSGFFLGVALTNLTITGLPPVEVPAAEPLWAAVTRSGKAGRYRQAGRLVDASPRGSGLDISVASRCGRCRFCLDACPTGALDASFRLDARLCIATWTIEWRGAASLDQRHLQGKWLFGCDICQAVCPWNLRSAARAIGQPPRREYACLPAHGEIDLADLIDLSQAEFRRRFRRTPLWRTHLEGMRRNALTVAANTGQRELVGRVARPALFPDDIQMQALARWARKRVEEQEP